MISRSTSADGKLPPRQALVTPGKWPVIGEKAPRRDPSPWRVSVAGLVERPRTFTLEELGALPQVEHSFDIHCVTRWSKLGVRFGGVELRELLDRAGPRREARYLSFVARSDQGHSTSLLLDDALALGTLLATTAEGRPLEETHGGPVRTVVPGRYFYKSLKWLERIEVLERDRLGTWEAESGYHNVADPWREERYVLPDLDRREALRLLRERDVSGRSLLGIEAVQRDLRGLIAVDAVLRDARFQEAELAGARFDRARLANAHFEGADLAGASFRDADIEGADFCGANLIGADFSGAHFFGASFCPEGGDDGWGEAKVDSTTRISKDQVERLSLKQQAFLLRS